MTSGLLLLAAPTLLLPGGGPCGMKPGSMLRGRKRRLALDCLAAASVSLAESLLESLDRSLTGPTLSADDGVLAMELFVAQGTLRRDAAPLDTGSTACSCSCSCSSPLSRSCSSGEKPHGDRATLDRRALLSPKSALA